MLQLVRLAPRVCTLVLFITSSVNVFCPCTPVCVYVCVCAIHTGTSGEVAFVNLLSGEHRVRVTAGDQDAVVRSRVIVMPDSPDFCSLNAINRGVTKHLGPDGAVANYTIEWRPIGVDAGFLCTVRGSGVAEKCNAVLVYL